MTRGHPSPAPPPHPAASNILAPTSLGQHLGGTWGSRLSRGRRVEGPADRRQSGARPRGPVPFPLPAPSPTHHRWRSKGLFHGGAGAGIWGAGGRPAADAPAAHTVAPGDTGGAPVLANRTAVVLRGIDEGAARTGPRALQCSRWEGGGRGGRKGRLSGLRGQRVQVNQLPHHSCRLQKIAELLLVDLCARMCGCGCICARARGAWARMWHTLEAHLRDVHTLHVT